MRTLKLTYPEAEQMFRRMVFNVMATNYDDHTKNFSFRLKKEGKWELSPAYDVCYSYDPNNIWVSQHTLSINGKHKDITKTDLMTIASANNIKKGEKIIDEIKFVSYLYLRMQLLPPPVSGSGVVSSFFNSSLYLSIHPVEPITTMRHKPSYSR